MATSSIDSIQLFSVIILLPLLLLHNNLQYACSLHFPLYFHPVPFLQRNFLPLFFFLLTNQPIIIIVISIIIDILLRSGIA